MSDIAKIVGMRIRKYRKELGMSQEQLAEKANMHNNYIGQLERGEKNATLESIEKVAIALDISLEELLEKIIILNRKKVHSCSMLYELIESMEYREQETICVILKKIMEFKNL